LFFDKEKNLFSVSLQISIAVESFSVTFSFAILRQQNDKIKTEMINPGS